MVGCEDTDDSADDPSGNKTLSFDVSSVSCSICLDFVIDSGNRSRAKLQCGHEFHLDCIGSAFNMKGAMQCPNCRKVERGRWLYAGGSTFSFPEFSIDGWTPDEDPYELSYSEMPFRVHWCPFSGLGRVHSSFEEVESPSTTYHNVQRHHAIFADQHTAASSVAHSYVAYFGPIPPTSSNTHESVEGSPGHNEIFTAHTFPFIGIHYQSQEHHSNPFSTNSGHVNSADQASVPLANLRSTRREYDAMTRSGSFMRPFLCGHGSARRGGSSFFSSIVHPSSNSRSQQRIPASHAIHHPQQPINPPGVPSPAIPVLRRFNGPRSLPPVVSAASQSDHSGGGFISLPPGSLGRNLHETQNSLPNHFPTWERDHTSPLPVISSGRDLGWASVHHAASGGSDSRNRSGSFWHRH